MKALLLAALVACAAPPAPEPVNPADLPQETLPPPSWSNATVHRATKEEARTLLSSQDAFMEAMSPFDRAVRQKVDAPPMDAFLSFVGSQAEELSQADWDRLRPMLDTIGSALQRLSVPLPASVSIVKTTGLEEFDVPYTRRNAIILPASLFRGEKGVSLGLLAHELFHVASRNDAFRDVMYAFIGFLPIPAVAIPASLDARRITNPDGHSTRHAISVQPASGPPVSVVPILQSRKAAAELTGSPLEALELLLLVVDAKTGAVLVDEKGAPRTLKPEATDYLKRCSINTGYAIHPDEVLADNFSLLVRRRAGEKVEAEHPELLDKIEQALLIIR